MTNVLSGRFPRPAPVVYDNEIAILARRLSPGRRRILAAVIDRVRDADDDESEAEACAIIDEVMAILRYG